jgi:predicted nucleotidyltransferase
VDVNGDSLIPGARSLDRVFKERMFAKSGGVAEALRVELSREAIADFCRRWHIRELAISGSALREDFRPDSDVDVSVTFEELEMAYELEALFGRKVDLVERRMVEQSKNYIRRKHILSHLGLIYVA